MAQGYAIADAAGKHAPYTTLLWLLNVGVLCVFIGMAVGLGVAYHARAAGSSKGRGGDKQSAPDEPGE